MRIGIEAQRIFRKKKHGMDMVALQLIRHLQELDTVNEYFIFTAPGDDTSVLQETPNFHIITAGPSFYPLWENRTLPQLCKTYQIDLLHCTSNTAPVFCNVPMVVTLHDVIFMESNMLFKKGFALHQRFGNIYRKWNLKLIAKKVQRWITVSEFERKNILNRMQFSSDKVYTVYTAMAGHFNSEVNEAQKQAIREKYQLPEKFLFFFGNTDPKKNTANVLKAYQMYSREVSQPLPLVIADLDETTVKALSGSLPLPGTLHLPGYIANQDLPAFYAMAEVFLYPSKRESFGIPLLEAMACGTPVITSNTSALPEVAGNAALLCDPNDAESIANHILEVLDNNMLRQALIYRGKQRAEEFNWKNSARKMLIHYHQVLNQPITNPHIRFQYV